MNTRLKYSAYDGQLQSKIQTSNIITTYTMKLIDMLISRHYGNITSHLMLRKMIIISSNTVK